MVARMARGTFSLFDGRVVDDASGPHHSVSCLNTNDKKDRILMTSSFKFAGAIVSGAFMALGLAQPAFAHVGLEKPETERGRSYKAVLKVPHGCDGQATHTVRVEIPEGFIGVKPMPKAGWTVKTVRGAYAQTYGYYHGPLKEGVRQLEWSGGSLPDDFYDEFVAAGFIARELTDPVLYFKVVQVCDKGELAWVDIPSAGVDPHDLKAPAARLKIAGAVATADTGKTAGAKASTGSLSVEDAWARATAEGAKVGAGYVTIHNSGSAPDTLVSVETPLAARGEVHDMTMEDGVMRMRRLDALEIPAGGSVELKPGGKHLMLMNLKERLVEGGSVPVTLTFKSGAKISIDLPVRPLGAGSSGHGHGDDKGSDAHDGHGHEGHNHDGHSHH